jgi:hypothetical protein
MQGSSGPAFSKEKFRRVFVRWIEESEAMKRILLTVMLIMTARTVHASLTINAEAIKKAVVFIYPSDAHGAADAARPLGTGFFVSVPAKSGADEYVFLVTARHVLDPSWAGCASGLPAQKVFLRLNLKTFNPIGDERGVDFVPIDFVVGNKSRLFESSDSQIDAAMLLLGSHDVPQDKYEFSSISIVDFATEAELGLLGTGDAIVSAGLVPGAQGERRNYPVFKFGAISNVLDEPFLTQCDTPTKVPEKVWLLSVNLFPGTSGSPIFYEQPGRGGIIFGAAVDRPCLIGVQSSSLTAVDVSAMTPIEPVFKIIEDLKLPNADLFRGPKPPPQ